MKKLILLAAMLLLGAFTALYAVPANKAKFKYTQPDGTVIVLQNHGDEYYHWTTNEAGEIVEKGADGFYRPSVSAKEHMAQLSRARLQRNGRNRAAWSSWDNPHPTNFGERKVLCIIAAWSDLPFTVDDPHTRFDNMLNQEGYSYNGAIGSVRDYYIDNSLGQYIPSFDVYGPVTLSQPMDYYSGGHGDMNEYKVYEAISEAYEMLKDQIPIDDYDTDGDGFVDMILFYYPGTNPAEGGLATNIWPHQSNTGGGEAFGDLGTKKFNRYFCTSELRGTEKSNSMCPIGTTCHEFGHSLGLPDFYDVNYAETGYNRNTTDEHDLMCSGSYNDEGRRPPYLSAVERNMLGWMPPMEELSPGDYELGPVQQDKGYIVQAPEDGEYYVLETRNGDKWDSYLSYINQCGLLIYHVDQSGAYDVSAAYEGFEGLTGNDLWTYTNYINAFGGHPCYYLVRSHCGSYSYPDKEGNTKHYFTDWSGQATGTILSNIAFDGTKASFTISQSDGIRPMYGYVYNSAGRPIEGAEIVLTPSAHSFGYAAPGRLSGDVVTTTDARGYYVIERPSSASSEQILTVRKDGYCPVSMNMPLDGFATQDFYLIRSDEGEHASLQYYDFSDEGKNYISRVPDAEETLLIANFYTPDYIEEKGLAGSRIEKVHLRLEATTLTSLHLIIMIGSEVALVRDITDQYVPKRLTYYPVEDAGIIIPEGKIVRIMYRMAGFNTDEYYLYIRGPYQPEAGVYSLDGGETWKYKIADDQPFGFIIGAEVSKTSDNTYQKMGFASIVLEGGVPTAVAPTDKTLYRVDWELDGTPIEAPTSLAEGTHTYMARLVYYDGTSERVYYETE